MTRVRRLAVRQDRTQRSDTDRAAFKKNGALVIRSTSGHL